MYNRKQSLLFWRIFQTTTKKKKKKKKGKTVQGSVILYNRKQSLLVWRIVQKQYNQKQSLHFLKVISKTVLNENRVSSFGGYFQNRMTETGTPLPGRWTDLQQEKSKTFLGNSLKHYGTSIK